MATYIPFDPDVPAYTAEGRLMSREEVIRDEEEAAAERRRREEARRLAPSAIPYSQEEFAEPIRGQTAASVIGASGLYGSFDYGPPPVSPPVQQQQRPMTEADRWYGTANGGQPDLSGANAPYQGDFTINTLRGGRAGHTDFVGGVKVNDYQPGYRQNVPAQIIPEKVEWSRDAHGNWQPHVVAPRHVIPGSSYDVAPQGNQLTPQQQFEQRLSKLPPSKQEIDSVPALIALARDESKPMEARVAAAGRAEKIQAGMKAAIAEQNLMQEHQTTEKNNLALKLQNEAVKRSGQPILSKPIQRSVQHQLTDGMVTGKFNDVSKIPVLGPQLVEDIIEEETIRRNGEIGVVGPDGKPDYHQKKDEKYVPFKPKDYEELAHIEADEAVPPLEKEWAQGGKPERSQDNLSYYRKIMDRYRAEHERDNPKPEAAPAPWTGPLAMKYLHRQAPQQQAAPAPSGQIDPFLQPNAAFGGRPPGQPQAAPAGMALRAEQPASARPSPSEYVQLQPEVRALQARTDLAPDVKAKYLKTAESLVAMLEEAGGYNNLSKADKELYDYGAKSFGTLPKPPQRPVAPVAPKPVNIFPQDSSE